MLVLSRKIGERILIGDNVTITVVRILGGSVRLGVEAPAEMAIVRQELKEQMSAETPVGSDRSAFAAVDRPADR